MILITGGAGFIGSSLASHFIEKEFFDIGIVDDLYNGKKFFNLSNLPIIDYFDIDEFLNLIDNDDSVLNNIEAILHMGACTSTTEWDGRYMMKINFSYSKKIFDFCFDKKIPLIYASSASVYGIGKNGFKEKSISENPINIYGFSKLVFDNYVRKRLERPANPVLGLRFFNVYGDGEAHKGDMASTIYRFNQQIQDTGFCNVFKGDDLIKDGMHERDFVYIKDLVKVISWGLKEKKSGIFNLGTGETHTFNDIANNVIRWNKENKNINGKINYIKFPDHLVGSYQSFTKADISSLREAGYKSSFTPLDKGIFDYLNTLHRGC